MDGREEEEAKCKRGVNIWVAEEIGGGGDGGGDGGGGGGERRNGTAGGRQEESEAIFWVGMDKEATSIS